LDLRPIGLSKLHNLWVNLKSNIRPFALAIWSIWMIWVFGFYTLGVRLWTRLDGTITSSRDVPLDRGPRYITEYTLRTVDGRDTSYTAGPTDSSIPRSMPVGTVLQKRRWRLGFERNGSWVNDFGLTFYVVILAVGFGCLLWSFFLWRGQRR
jgi:hypothetical protein